MYDNDGIDPREDSDGPEAGFRALHNRPADEVDGDALWRRIEGDLEPHAAKAGWFGRLAALAGLDEAPALPQLAAAGAVVVLMLGIVWWAPSLLGPTEPGGLTPAGSVGDAGPVAADASPADAASDQLVPLAVGDPDNAAAPVAEAAWQLEVRLVRGFDGAVPADALPSAGAGAGGADVLLDLRGALGGLLPFEDFALVGQWQGAMQADQTTAPLSDSFELTFDSSRTAEGVALANVQLAGAGRPLVAEQLALTPGQPYLFGVQASGETAAAGSLVLAVRLVPATDDGQ